jgi:hypothetical protein
MVRLIVWSEQMAIILILFGITIIIYSLYSLLKETESPKENSFKAILKDSADNIDDTKVLIGEMRREFAETILELQKEIISLRENTSVAEEHIGDSESIVIGDFNVESYKSETPYSVNSIRINDIERLLKEGYSIDEISEKLEVNKGEILLIKDLYLK